MTAYNEDKIATVERSSSSEAAMEQYQYEYLTGGDGETRLEKVTLRRRAKETWPWQYDDEEAHTVLHAHPSSIDSYTFDAASELSVTLKANERLIEVTDYYTTTGSGAVNMLPTEFRR